MTGNPTTTTFRPDPVLVNLAVLAVAAQVFVADIVMPVVPVVNDSYKYAQYDASHLIDDVAIDRAIGDSANTVTMNRTYATGATSHKSLKMDLAREVVEQAVNPNSVENQRVMTVTGRVKLGIEKKVRDKLVALTGQATPSVKWDAASGVTIKKNVDAAKKLFRAQCGRDPNVILIPQDVAVVMSNDDDIIKRDKRTTNEQLTSGDLPGVLFGMRVVIAGAMAKDTPVAGLAEIWNTDDVWLLYIDPNVSANGGDVLTFGAQFRAPSHGVPVAAGKWADQDLSANKDWYFVDINQAEQVLSEACALRMADVLT